MSRHVGSLLPRKPRKRRLGPAIYVPRCTTVLDRRKGHRQPCWNRLLIGQHIGPCETCAEILQARQS
jgi:hypothetical protein